MKFFVETRYGPTDEPTKLELAADNHWAKMLAGCSGSEIVWVRPGGHYFEYRYFSER